MSMLYTVTAGARTVHRFHAVPGTPVRYDIRGDGQLLATMTFDHHGQVTFELSPEEEQERQPHTRTGTHSVTVTTQELDALRWAARIIAEDSDTVPALTTGKNAAALARARRKLDTACQPSTPEPGQ